MKIEIGFGLGTAAGAGLDATRSWEIVARSRGPCRSPAAGRPQVDPRSLVVIDANRAHPERSEACIAAGASKFVLVPLVVPPSWSDTLSRSFEAAVGPLEGTR